MRFSCSTKVMCSFVWFVLFLMTSGWLVGQDFPPQTPAYDDDDLPASYGDEEPPPPPPPDLQPAPAPVVPLPPVVLPQKVVTIGRIPFMSLKEMMEQSRVLFSYLKKEMGVKEVRLVTAKDYAGVLESLARGAVDFAWVGPMAYVIAKDRSRLVPLAKTKRQSGVAYRGVFIARKGGRIQGLDDIKGKTIGFVDPESASGYLYPLYVLQRLKIDPHKACSKVEFLKKHDAVLAAVLERKIDAGVCLEHTLDSVKDPKILNQILVLGKTDEIPSDVLVCREDCPTNLREGFQNALLKTATLASDGKAGSGKDQMPTFLPTHDGEFDSAREVLKLVSPVMKRP